MSKILEKIRRGADSHGPFVQALVVGERFPVVFLSDPPLSEVIDALRQRGVQMPDEVPYFDYTKESPAYVHDAGGGIGMIDSRVNMYFDVAKNELVVDRMEPETSAKTKSGLGL